VNSKLIIRKMEESLDNIRAITRVFEHSAARKMDVNRDEIGKLVNHLNEAVNSYSYVKIAQAGNKKNRDALLASSWRSIKKKKVLILVTSESKYVGNLVDAMVKQFILEFSQGGSDAIVIGEVGKNLLAKQGFSAPNVIYFDFNDDKPDWNVVSKVNEQLTDYGQIVIFYGQYKSILTQELKREDISQAIIVKSVPNAKKYDFEPSALEALGMLEKQIISSSFLQKLYETGLTKNAVAVKVLEIGFIAERINVSLVQIAKYKLKLSKDVNNRKQTQLFGSRDLWEKGGLFAKPG